MGVGVGEGVSAMKDSIVEFAKHATHGWGTVMGCDQRLSMSREALAWSENMNTTETSDHGEYAVTLRAIEYMHDSQACNATV